MINWKNHKAALTGASQYLIKGIIQIIHSATSASQDTEDCFVGFIGTITDSAGFISSIDDSPVARIGTIDDDPIATIGTLFPTQGFSGIIDPSDIGFIGTVTDSAGFEGEICGC